MPFQYMGFLLLISMLMVGMRAEQVAKYSFGRDSIGSGKHPDRVHASLDDASSVSDACAGCVLGVDR